MTTQPEALRLAGALLEPVVLDKHAMQAADELRRLHAECEALRSVVDRLLSMDVRGYTLADRLQFTLAGRSILDAARAAKEQSNDDCR